MGKSRLLRVVCPNCGKTVAAYYSARTSDGCNLLTYKHNDREGRPCPQVEVAR